MVEEESQRGRHEPFPIRAMTVVKANTLSSRCVSEHPSFAEVELLAQTNLLLPEPAKTEQTNHHNQAVVAESFCLLKDNVVVHHDDDNDDENLVLVQDIVENDNTETPTQSKDKKHNARKPRCLDRRVSFTSLEIREYSVVPGSHPECSSGCPIELGWEYRSLNELSLDHYESVRNPRRPRDQLRLSVQERESILSANGSEPAQVRRAARRHHRSKSCEGRFCQRNNQTFFQKAD